MKKQFVVIGLGRFGGSVTKTLISLGYEVMGIDKDERRVQEYASILTHVYQGDSTDDQVMRELGIRNMDHAIVAIGEDLQSSILTTLILKDMGVKFVTAKATSDYHQRVLEGVGADHIVHPERDTGVRVAHQVTSKNMIEYLELSPEYSLVEIIAPETFGRKTLKTLDFRAKFGCSVMAIRRTNNELVVSPHADEIIFEGDMLVIIGKNTDIARFERTFED
ncbi:TrkA family potassium uptake protein [Paenibacillus sp. GSMTC-2017]|uniref:potassium channel family protein n=1 Tax=Paenibacillus sp. GSMTC-2017 TaxID=2794350 RepID=UPI0018D6A43D|nr:TrkA family potassium uptake protein [Paenibacillus sp. GSMTC-2017]MBH5318279.1 TrkA family potassium uptake protein [Paenibacillus sp. GSMTC-2017]